MIHALNGTVLLRFAEPVEAIGMTPDQALKLSEALREYALKASTPDLEGVH